MAPTRISRPPCSGSTDGKSSVRSHTRSRGTVRSTSPISGSPTSARSPRPVSSAGSACRCLHARTGPARRAPRGGGDRAARPIHLPAGRSRAALRFPRLARRAADAGGRRARRAPAGRPRARARRPAGPRLRRGRPRSPLHDSRGDRGRLRRAETRRCPRPYRPLPRIGDLRTAAREAGPPAARHRRPAQPRERHPRARRGMGGRRRIARGLQSRDRRRRPREPDTRGKPRARGHPRRPCAVSAG